MCPCAATCADSRTSWNCLKEWTYNTCDLALRLQCSTNRRIATPHSIYLQMTQSFAWDCKEPFSNNANVHNNFNSAVQVVGYKQNCPTSQPRQQHSRWSINCYSHQKLYKIVQDILSTVYDSSPRSIVIYSCQLYFKNSFQHILVGGFNPSEKYENQLGLLFPIYGKS